MQFRTQSAFPLVFLLLAAAPSFAQDRFTISADGQEVSDRKTSLTWRRCAEGQAWKGKTCAGPAAFMNQSDAAARAKAAGGDWRLPVLKELSSIVAVREADGVKAAIDPTAFPGTPAARFWTASNAGPGYFTYVGFSDGSAGENPRSSPGAVRLVKGGQP